MVTVRAYRVGALRPDPPVSITLFGESAWGDVPAAGWVRFRGRLVPTRNATVPGGWVDRESAGRLVPAGGTGPEWGPGRPPAMLVRRAALARRVRSALRGFPARLAEAMLLGRRERAHPRGTRGVPPLRGVAPGGGERPPRGASGRTRRLAPGRCAAVDAERGGGAGRMGLCRTGRMVPLGGARRHPGDPGHRGIPGPAAAALSGVARPGAPVAGVGRSGPDRIGELPLVGRSGGGNPPRPRDRPPPAGLRGILAGPAAAGLGAQWGTLPAALAAFGTLSPLALLPNLAAIPLAGLFLPAVLVTLASAGTPGAGGDRA